MTAAEPGSEGASPGAKALTLFERGPYTAAALN